MTATAAFFPGVPTQSGRQTVRVEPTNQALGLRDELLAYARTLLGVPYEINLPGYPRQRGGRGFGKRYPELDKGLDCSGYVLKVLQHHGMLTDLNPDFTSCDTLSAHCVAVEEASAKPGELVFFRGTYNTAGLSHVGFVIDEGGKTMISAREPGVGVDPLTGGFWRQHLAGYARVKRFPD